MTYLTGGTPTLSWNKTDRISNTIRAAFQEQSEIGWKHIFLGRLSMQWKYAQHQYYSHVITEWITTPKNTVFTNLGNKPLQTANAHRS